MKTCFLMSPLGDPDSEVRRLADGLYELIVEPVCAQLGYQLVRVDRVPIARSITQEIIRLAFEADLVIADLTNLNPNVMYELGVRHAVGKPAIQMSQAVERIPFDLASYRTIIYDLRSPNTVRKARETLSEAMNFLESQGAAISPVTDALRTARPIEEAPPDRAEASSYGPLLRSIAERLGAIEGTLGSISVGIEETKAKREFTRDIFIVHGHDGELKNELARFLQKLDFNPVILHEQADRGDTIIQKLQYEGSRVGYAFVLHTPDDEGRQRRSDVDVLQPRSRQNVVFEHGMFVGQFSHRRVCAIVRQNVEIPSDLSGVIYKRIPEGAGINSVAFELVNELRAAGYVVDANKLLA